MATAVRPVAKRPRRNNSAKLPNTSDAVEIAMAAAASGKPLPDAARVVLEKHATLIDRQAELAQAQCSELKLRKIGEGVRAALWATLAVAAFAVVALVVLVLVRASRTDALVVQSFRVPPALHTKGLTGEVVATRVLDKLAEMEGRTNSVRAASTYANNWEDDLKIDIPNTGASATEVWKLLRGWLGKETRISGEVVESGGGLVLTTRVGSSPGRRYESATGDLESLITQGAELIYHETQPYRYAIYIARTGRETERYSVLTQLTKHASETERKWAYSGLSFDLNMRGEFAESVRMANRALAIDPRMAPAFSNAGRAYSMLGREQTAVEMSLAASRYMGSDEYDPAVAARNRCSLLRAIGWPLRDPVSLDKAAACSESADYTIGSGGDPTAGTRASAALLRHDPVAALAVPLKGSADEPPQVTVRRNAQLRLWTEMVRGASPQLTMALAEFRKVAALPANVGLLAENYRAGAPTQDWPFEATALMMLGRTDEATALIARTPLNCYECVRVRGVVAQAQGNAVTSQRWFAEAIRQGPRLPAAYVDLGRLFARHRRWAAAEANFAEAARIAPNWADPLKYWGDALAAQRKRGEARAKYDAAAKLAPRWAELNVSRARLHKRG